MNITEEMLVTLRQLVRPWLTEKRYAHTLAVEKEVAELARIYLPAQENKLRAAALLHDITKKADLPTQLQYCAEYGLPVTAEDKCAPKTFHARTAAAVAEREFAAYADPEVIDGIRWHTTGHKGMTILESLVYLADYIEETRTFPDCVTLRRYFYENLTGAKTECEKQTVLQKTLLLSFDMTIRGLLEEGAPIGKDTFDARNELIYTLKFPASANDQR